MPDQSQGFMEDVECASASEFLDALSPLGPVFRDAYLDERQSPSWIHRGQARSSWSLTPAAFRAGVEFPSATVWRARPGAHSRHEQVDLELQAVARFFHLADRQGLPIPEDSQRLRSLLDPHSIDAYGRSFDAQWPHDEALSLLGLAQHHGVPTRLLDWSRDAYTAAYFAVVNAASEPRANSNAVVWSLSVECMRSLSYEAVYEHRRTPKMVVPSDTVWRPAKGLEVVSPLAAWNPNLGAQKAVFTLYRYREHPVSSGVNRTQDLCEILRGEWDERSDWTEFHVDFPPWLRRTLLPHSECREALALLARHGVSSATLFPGYEGVVKALEEERLWTDKP